MEISIKQRFSPNRNRAGIGCLQKIQAAQQRRFTGAGGPDNR